MIAAACSAFGDLARPTALYGNVAAVLLAVAMRADVSVVGALCASLGVLYGAKAAENVGVARATGAKP